MDVRSLERLLGKAVPGGPRAVSRGATDSAPHGPESTGHSSSSARTCSFMQLLGSEMKQSP